MMTLNMEPKIASLLAIAAFLIISSLPAFFWVRGIVKSNRSDLIAGFVLLCFVNPVAMSLSNGVCAAISGLWYAMMLFGLATVIAGWFAKPNCPLQKRDRSAIATGFVIIGFFLSAALLA